ncbi:MAG: YggS family pyridoxal phosphate-dependent enzyme [Bacteroidia bacterium]
MVRENLAKIRQEIAEIATKAGRKPEEIQLIAVSKSQSKDKIIEALAAGQVLFGENRPQEMKEKAEELQGKGVEWHLIGQLQRNKVRQVVGVSTLIHSVDSLSLLSEIDRRGEANDLIVNCLLQINISDEPQKGGLEEEDAEKVLLDMEFYPNVRILGLMGIAEFTDDRDLIRTQFRRLKNAHTRFSTIQHPRVEMKELSMGMSSDFDIAIEEGATMVRVGTAIFGSRY